MSLRKDLRVFTGIPMLRRGDEYEGFLKSCLRHISNQDVDLDILPPYVSPGTNIKWRRGETSRLDAITQQLNLCVEAGINTDADIICIVDADVEVPPNWLRELLLLDVHIASGVYTYHNSNKVIFGYIPPTKIFKMDPMELTEIRGTIIGGHQFIGGGNGCLVVKRKVFEKPHPKYSPLRFHSPGGIGSDLLFWWDAQNIGFSARVHGGIICGHQPDKPLKDIHIWGK